MVLLTGATGFIGSHLVQRLSSEEIKNIVLFLRESSKKSLINKNPKNLIIKYGDLLDQGSIERSFKNIETVLHLASIRDEKNPHDIYDNNIKATRNIIEVSQKNNVRRFIYIGIISSVSADQDNEPYHKAKRECEKIVLDSGIPYVIIRLTLVFGELYFAKTVTRMVNMIKYLPIIPIIGNGQFKIQPIYVEDAVSFILYVLQNISVKNVTYDLGGKMILTYEEFIDLIMETWGYKKIKLHVPLFIVLPIVKVYETLFPRSFLNVQKIKIFCKSQFTDINNVTKAFEDSGIRWHSLKDSLRKWKELREI